MAENTFDYSFVGTTARIALYDDLRSAPRVTKIDPAPTTDYIYGLASEIAKQSKDAGGKIPFSVILEVTENFIHAQFREVVVSILDDGNTIRFADQGPGIPEKEKAQEPGFSSATQPMKDYIRGVGSGLPIVKDYLTSFDGSIVIEDNLNTGAVVTISLVKKPSEPERVAAERPIAQTPMLPKFNLTEREQDFLRFLYREGDLRVTDLINLTGLGNSTVYNTLERLEENALVEKTGKKRTLTDLGTQLARTL